MREETHSEILKTVRKMKSGNAPDLSTMNRTCAKQAKKGFADWLKDMTYDPIIFVLNNSYVLVIIFSFP